jgi:hypothetical protein
MGTAIENITIEEQDKSNKETTHDNTNTYTFLPPLHLFWATQGEREPKINNHCM